jgi:hypothetical protein
MGNTNCRTLVTNYIVTSDPYYKLHYLVSLILYGLLYFNYLKDEAFDEYENRFVVFISKYILMPIIVTLLVSIAFFYIVSSWRRKLIFRAVQKCAGKLADDITDRDLIRMRNDAMRELSTSASQNTTSANSSSASPNSSSGSPNSSSGSPKSTSK